MNLESSYRGDTILVSGATGLQGGAIAKKLLQEGWNVRALTRDPSSSQPKLLEDLGAQIVKGDMEDLPSLTKALKGVYGVFSMQTFLDNGTEAEIRQGENLAKASKEAGVQHFVYSSELYTDHYTGVPHWDSKIEIESYIHSFGIPLTIFRSAFFMENFLREDHLQFMTPGKISLPLRPLCIRQYLSIEDLAIFVAKAFTNPADYIGEEVFLAGDELNMNELTNIFAKVLELDLKYVPMPKLVARFRIGKAYSRMYRWLDRRKIDDMSGADIEALRKEFPELQTLDDWLTKLKSTAETDILSASLSIS